MSQSVVSDAELLSRMVRQREEPVCAREAWGELYSRHRRYLFVVVQRAYGSFLGQDGSADLVVDALRRAYEWAGRQGCAEEVRARFTSESVESTRRQVLGWLGAIAERLFTDRFRESATGAERFDEYVEDLRRSEPKDAESSANAGAAGCVRAAMASLDQADRDVLRLSLPWYDFSTRSFVVPRGEGARLAAMIGLSPDAFRQRRHRALGKIEVYLRKTAPAAEEQRQ